MTPAVSVLLPLRDAVDTLAACLRSLLAQTLADFELVLVDDGSRDDSAELARSLWPDDDRLRLLSSQGGLVCALNHGLERCRAPLVARMDADDACAPERLELQRQQLDACPELGVVGSLVRVETADGGAPAEGWRLYAEWLNGLLEPRQIAGERFVESPLAHPSVMYRRELVLAHGGYHDRGWPEDYDLWLRLLEAGVRIAKVPRELLVWRDHPGRLSRRCGRYGRDAFARCRAHHLARGPLAAGRPLVIWGAGPTGRRMARLLAAEGVRLTAFVDISPRLIGRQRQGVPVLSPEQLGPPAGRMLVAAVAARGARQQIRDCLEQLGWVEGSDAWFAA